MMSDIPKLSEGKRYRCDKCGHICTLADMMLRPSPSEWVEVI